MNPFDFVSGPPTFYIFQKKYNKTNFGGALSLIYCIIMIAITIYYMFDFKNTYLKDSYTVQSFTRFTKKTIEHENEEEKDHHSQNINFRVEFKDPAFMSLDRLGIYKKNTNQKFPNPFANSTDNFPQLYLAYKCEEKDCGDYYQNLDRYETNFTFSLLYDGFTLDHQNNDKPIQKGGSFSMEYKIDLNQVTSIDNVWKQIIYKEKKGYFHNDYMDFAFYIDEFKKREEKFEFTILTDDEFNPILIFCYLSIEINNNNIVEYTRTKKSILTLFANVCSLFSNIYFMMCFITKYYSRNFDNYKIIESTLSKKKNSQYDQKTFTSLENLEKENNYKKNEKNFPILKDNDESADRANINNNNLENDDDDGLDFKLKKIGFYHFYINYLYSNFCCKNNTAQNIINVCNEIIDRYSSMDKIIYNQILLENLLKDYRWNNIELSDLRNHHLFEKLKVLESLES